MAVLGIQLMQFTYRVKKTNLLLQKMMNAQTNTIRIRIYRDSFDPEMFYAAPSLGRVYLEVVVVYRVLCCLLL